MLKKIAVGGAATALALSGAGIAMAAASGNDNPQEAGAHSLGRKTDDGVFKCDGGRQKAVKTRIVSSPPFTYVESDGLVAVPGAAVKIGGPASGKDTLNVAFSAETQLSGTTGVQDWQGLEIHVDGVPINPYTAAGDVLALNGEPSWGMHGGNFCVRVGPGVHTVEAFTNLADFDTDDALRGWLDDYTLKVERSE